MIQFYVIPDPGKMEESERLARELGLQFEYNDFIFPSFMDDEAAVEQRIADYRKLSHDFSKDTMHGAFFDVTVFSFDGRIREVSLLRMRQSMEVARKLGLRGVVFHGNHCPFLHGELYDNNWIKCTEETIRELAKDYPDIEIFMENMFDDTPEMLVRLAERLEDVENFGICLDYSHAQLASKDGKLWFKALAKYIRHMHVNDHCFAGDVHMVPGTGMTDWEEFFHLKEKYAPEATVLCEVTGLEKAERGIDFLKSKM